MAIQPLFDEPFLRAQWGSEFESFQESPEAAALMQPGATLTVETTDTPLRDRILALDHEITTLDATIAQREAALNTLTYPLFRLTPEEVATVEAG